ANFLTHGIDHLRFGESLRPLELSVPETTYTESAKADAVTAPAVLNSVTRSHRDGSVAVVFTNISDNPVSFEWDPGAIPDTAAPRQLHRMNEQGAMESVPPPGASGKHALTIAPYDIVFFVLK
ncbi:MAG TPA: hypothetical protein PLS03_14565, partial [Terrimicrobiaceae bacterium]|nr:hypothetical protein [Terrimicrobiaceae bacterium]